MFRLRMHYWKSWLEFLSFCFAIMFDGVVERFLFGYDLFVFSFGVLGFLALPCRCRGLLLRLVLEEHAYLVY
jgi:hypothetical protein